MLKVLQTNFIVRYVSDILQTYARKRGPILAKGIAYSFLNTSIPLLFIGFYISTLLFSPTDELKQLFLLQLAEIIPQQVAEYLVTYLFEVILDRNWIKIGAIGMISLLIVPRGLFSCMERSLVTVMESPKDRPLLKRQFLYFLLIIAAICLFFFASYIFIGVKTIFILTKVPPKYYFLGSKAVSILFICTALIVIYRVCYHEKIESPILISVSLGVALIWQVINYIGTSIITISSKKELVYGIFASGAVFLLWAYIFAIFLLLGGIVIGKHTKINQNKIL